MTLDDELRAELRAVHVPYDGPAAEQLVTAATSARRGTARWGAPLAAAAAVLALAGGGAAFALTGRSGGSAPAGDAGPSQPVAYTTPAPTVPRGAALPADLQPRIEQCIQTQGNSSWGDSNDCADVESRCEIAAALDTSPCSLIPRAVVCNSPAYILPVRLADGSWAAVVPGDKTDLCPGVLATPTPQR